MFSKNFFQYYIQYKFFFIIFQFFYIYLKNRHIFFKLYNLYYTFFKNTADDTDTDINLFILSKWFIILSIINHLSTIVLNPFFTIIKRNKSREKSKDDELSDIYQENIIFDL